jgi:hypothetical protein
MPVNPPMIAPLPANIKIRVVDEGEIINDIINNGASFCHVERMNAVGHEIAVITEGYHMWHGTIPIFRIRDIVSMRIGKVEGIA